MDVFFRKYVDSIFTAAQTKRRHRPAFAVRDQRVRASSRERSKPQTVACALCHVVEKVCRITTRESPVRKVLRVEPQSGEQFVIAVIDAPVVFADMDQDFPQPALFVSFLCGYGKSPDY
ncbi:hypothetical protein [Paraburkholderia youngii]|uniref:hypothetical protein n=1 Tax=Paraburkholderia youngii TaxID=2782701 RepID=UPI003D1C4F20